MCMKGRGTSAHPHIRKPASKQAPHPPPAQPLHAATCTHSHTPIHACTHPHLHTHTLQTCGSRTTPTSIKRELPLSAASCARCSASRSARAAAASACAAANWASRSRVLRACASRSSSSARSAAASLSFSRCCSSCVTRTAYAGSGRGEGAAAEGRCGREGRHNQAETQD